MEPLQQSEPIYQKECYEIIGACMEVHNTLGCGFPEAVYQEALEIEFEEQNIPFLSQYPLNVYYKGQKLKKEFVPDFICFDKIIVELKASSTLVDENQTLSYLKSSEFRLGILVNFGTKSLQYKRIVL
ncbi:MAG TPA: GxxExxY protein [Prolixibacteraceae bacterium]|nr:GxxExxY protein [Prolixibacteraceae bacterium]HPS13902.1 GxxExxY protein [Prolixibacteraceae bacterium]